MGLFLAPRGRKKRQMGCFGGIDLPEFYADPRFHQIVTQMLGTVNENNRRIRTERTAAQAKASDRAMRQELLQEMRQLKDALKQPSPVQEVVPPAVVVAASSATKPYSRYAPDMDVSIGCIPCTRAHLATIAASLKEAEAGHLDQVAAAREEIVALREYDLTPDKLAATPERDRVVLAKYDQALGELQEQLKGPAPEATVASASLKEALRFAREDGVGHPEVQIRMERTEEAINALERVTLAPERLGKLPPEEAKRARSVLPDLRRVRQDLINHVQTPEDLEAVTARIAVIDQTLNPSPPQEKVNGIAKRAQELNRQFRTDVLKSFEQGA